MSNFKFDFEKFTNRGTAPGMNPMKAHIVALVVTLIVMVVIDYTQLPAYNFRDPGFYFYVGTLLILFAGLDFFLSLKVTILNKTAALLAAAGVLFVIVFSIIGSEFFNASKYRNQIEIVEVSDFAKEYAPITLDKIPVVDKETAIRIGDKQIGTVAGLGSQFSIDSEYTLISSADKLYRVSPLLHRDIYKWFQNRNSGVPGFVKVNVNDPNDVELVMLEKGMKYSPSGFFDQNLYRHVRFKYRSDLLTDYSFELDDSGKPFWVVSTYLPKISMFGGPDATGVIIVDPVSGDMQKYDMDNIPEWVDRVQPTQFAWSQIDNWGYYVHGFFNTLFGQKDMIQTTEGYNYVNIDGQTHVFSGMTSVSADQSINGFALINLKTKKASYIKVGGADEYSAMQSSKGQVQHLGYSATFPILLNIHGAPTYFISLKDKEGLVKMYSFVDVRDYTIVGVGDTVELAQTDYYKKLKAANKYEGDIVDDRITHTGKVTAVTSAIVGGNSQYYFTLEGSDKLFMANIELSNELALTKFDDVVKVEFNKSEDSAVFVQTFDNQSYNFN